MLDAECKGHFASVAVKFRLVFGFNTTQQTNKKKAPSTLPRLSKILCPGQLR
jgi:hypothetical protein